MDYSIIICSYNPDERLLERCIKAVSRLITAGFTREIILVDNNSTIPLNRLDCVKKMLASIPESTYVIEGRQGLNYARIAGFEAASGQYLIFFDDDNEPQEDYLLRVKELNEALPNVGAWGPGELNVEFIDGVNEQYRQYAQGLFQERHENGTTYANIESPWQACYPFGTGLCISRTAVAHYHAKVNNNEYTSTGRTGASLASGDDTQLVLSCIKQGFAAGVSPALKVNHIIPAKKTREAYIRKLIYSTISCYRAAELQVFPNHRKQMAASMLPRKKLIIKALKRFIRSKTSSNPLVAFRSIAYLADKTSVYIALGEPIPVFVRFVLKRLGAV